MKIDDVLLNENNEKKYLQEIIKSKFFRKYYLNDLKKIALEYKEEKEKIKKDIPSILDEAVQVLDKPSLNHSSNIQDDIIELHLKKREKPRDSLEFVHNYVNKLSKERFGIGVRNLLFALPFKNIPSAYGQYKHMVFPIGDYSIFYTPNVDDFTTHMMVFGNQNESEYSLSSHLSIYLIDEVFGYDMDNANKESGIHSLFNKHMDELYSAIGEIVLDCDQKDIDGFTNCLLKNLFKFTRESIFKNGKEAYGIKRDWFLRKLKKGVNEYIDNLKHQLSYYVNDMKQTDEIKAKREEVMIYAKKFILIEHMELRTYAEEMLKILAP